MARKPKTIPWPDRLLFGTSKKGFAKLQKAREVTDLYLTNDENTAVDYAESRAHMDRSTPVIVEIDVDVLRQAGGSLKQDTDWGEGILEQFIYEGPLPRNFIRSFEELEP